MKKPKTPSTTPRAAAKTAAAKADTPAKASKAKPRRKGPPKAGSQDANGRFVKGTAIGAETRWREGESGNPSGRSSEVQSAQAEFERVLAEVAMQEVEVRVGNATVKMSRMRMMLTKLAEVGSSNGNNVVAANQEFFNRLVGKAKQPMEHSGLGNVYIVDTVEDVPDPRQQKPQQ